MPDGISIRRASREQAEEVAAVIRASFATVAEKFGDIPPLHETADDVLATIDAGDVALVAVAEDGRLVGTVRAETLADGTVMVRRLAVLPELRRNGLARELMRELEAAYPGAAHFELFTGADAAEPLALYRSLGYVDAGRREADYPFLVFLEKRRE